MDGILVVDKPAGPTSFDVVHRVRASLKVAKVGHTGTLDPMATGVLPICLGAATRLAGHLTEGDKEYLATVALGASTDTQDATGTVLQTRDVPALTRALLDGAIAKFLGPQQQVPPMYSAVKIDGKRLYEHARAGREIEREPRSITVHAMELLDFGERELKIRVACSKGTYVRTLAHDLGEALGCGAHLSALRRTKSGPFGLENAAQLKELMELGPARREEARRWLVPLADAFAEFPAITIDAATLAKKVAHGQPLDVPRSLEVPEGAKVRVLGPDGVMVAFAERNGPQLKYLRVLLGSGA